MAQTIPSPISTAADELIPLSGYHQVRHSYMTGSRYATPEVQASFSHAAFIDSSLSLCFTSAGGLTQSAPTRRRYLFIQRKNRVITLSTRWLQLYGPKTGRLSTAKVLSYSPSQTEPKSTRASLWARGTI